MAGIFLCLASAEGAGLLFCPAAIHPHTSVYNGFYLADAFISPNPQNSALGFADAFQAICRILTLLYGWCIKLCYTSCSTLDRITTPGRHPAHTRYHLHARTLYRPAQPHYYNKVYKSAAYRRPCQPGGVLSHCVRIAGKC